MSEGRFERWGRATARPRNESGNYDSHPIAIRKLAECLLRCIMSEL